MNAYLRKINTKEIIFKVKFMTHRENYSKIPSLFYSINKILFSYARYRKMAHRDMNKTNEQFLKFGDVEI